MKEKITIIKCDCCEEKISGTYFYVTEGEIKNHDVCESCMTEFVFNLDINQPVLIERIWE